MPTKGSAAGSPEDLSRFVGVMIGKHRVTVGFSPPNPPYRSSGPNITHNQADQEASTRLGAIGWFLLTFPYGSSLNVPELPPFCIERCSQRYQHNQNRIPQYGLPTKPRCAGALFRSSWVCRFGRRYVLAINLDLSRLESRRLVFRGGPAAFVNVQALPAVDNRGQPECTPPIE